MARILSTLYELTPALYRRRTWFRIAMVAAVVAMIMNMFMRFQKVANYEPHFDAEHHPYVAPTAGDKRSPCPALNTLANHGYLPHDGRKITNDNLVHALRDGYNVSPELATFLTYASHGILGQYTELSLEDISRHGFVEHDCSLVHRGTHGRDEYAPPAPVRGLFKKMLSHSSSGTTMTQPDFVSARVARDGECGHHLSVLHAEIARGEISMVLGIFGHGNETVQNDLLEDWWLHERFPKGWQPDHEHGLVDTVKGSLAIRRAMAAVGDS